MGRNNRRRLRARGGMSSARLGEKIVSVPFKDQVSVALTSGCAVLSLHPVNFDRIAAITDTFNLYRFVELEVELFPPYQASGTSLAATGAGTFSAAAYFSNTSDVATSSFTAARIIQLIYSTAMLSNGTGTAANSSVTYAPTVGSRRFKVPRKGLVGETSLKWYKSELGTPDSWDELQGAIVVGTTSSVTNDIQVVVSGICEFTAPISVDLTPKGFNEAMARQKAIRGRLDCFTSQVVKNYVAPDDNIKSSK